MGTHKQIKETQINTQTNINLNEIHEKHTRLNTKKHTRPNRAV